MTLRTAHPVAPYLLLAELGAALYGGTAAAAGERTTLEGIGAVRLAGPQAPRAADMTPARSETTQTREATAERLADVMAASHH